MNRLRSCSLFSAICANAKRNPNNEKD